MNIFVNLVFWSLRVWVVLLGFFFAQAMAEDFYLRLAYPEAYAAFKEYSSDVSYWEEIED